MDAYAITLSIHVITAVLGVGQVTALGTIAMTATDAKGISPIVAQILRSVIWSLLVMLLSGAVLTWLGHGLFERMWWFRISFVLFLFTGFLHARAKRALRNASGADGPGNLRPLAPIALAMIVTIGVIVVLMEVKPW